VVLPFSMCSYGVDEDGVRTVGEIAFSDIRITLLLGMVMFA